MEKLILSQSGNRWVITHYGPIAYIQCSPKMAEWILNSLNRNQFEMPTTDELNEETERIPNKFFVEDPNVVFSRKE